MSVVSKPSSGLLDVITKVMMLPQHALAGIAPDALAKNAWWSTSPVGTGPFKFGRYVTDQYVELAANPDYRSGKPAVDKVINRYFANTAGAVLGSLVAGYALLPALGMQSAAAVLVIVAAFAIVPLTFAHMDAVNAITITAQRRSAVP